MLIPKKISTKKIIIYLLIILLMIGGSGFMLYEKQRLTSYKINNANNFIASSNSAIVATTTTPINSSEVSIKNSDFDLSIFSSDKFKNLQETEFIIKQQPEVGKRDPFKPN